MEDEYYGYEKSMRSNHNLEICSGTTHLYVISAYAPQIWLEEHLKVKFQEDS